MLKLLSLKLDRTEPEVISLLNRASTEEKQGSDNVIRSHDWQTVKSVFQVFSSLTPESFRVNRLPILNLPKDVLESLSQGKVEYTKARAIARIKDDKKRKKLLQQAVEQNLSLSQIQEKISEPNLLNVQRYTSSTLQERIDSLYRRLRRNKVWEDPIAVAAKLAGTIVMRSSSCIFENGFHCITQRWSFV